MLVKLWLSLVLIDYLCTDVLMSQYLVLRNGIFLGTEIAQVWKLYSPHTGYFLVVSYTFSFSKCHQVNFGASSDSIVSLLKYLKAQRTEQDEK